MSDDLRAAVAALDNSNTARIVRFLTGTAGELHGREFPVPLRGEVWVCEPERSALVLGSTQDPALVSADAARRQGIEVAKRRSGGGAVLVEPDSGLWVDVFVAPGDPLWSDDIGVAAAAVGRRWSSALNSLGVPAEVYEGPMRGGRWGKQVCFAGLGPGEVVAPDTGAKLVGVSQRRTRAGARVQCHGIFQWDPAAFIELFAEGAVSYTHLTLPTICSV